MSVKHFTVKIIFQPPHFVYKVYFQLISRKRKFCMPHKLNSATLRFGYSSSFLPKNLSVPFWSCVCGHPVCIRDCKKLLSFSVWTPTSCRKFHSHLTTNVSNFKFGLPLILIFDLITSEGQFCCLQITVGVLIAISTYFKIKM